MIYKNCRIPSPHEPHMNDDHTRCVGVLVRDDRERTFDPKGDQRFKEHG